MILLSFPTSTRPTGRPRFHDIILRMQLTFHGGAESVTGANYVLEAAGKKILIDCGLHQGGHFAERKNFEDFPYDPRGIDAVFVTHAHIDHIGLLPKLHNKGFAGHIYSTAPTKDFAELLLLDSEGILAKEAEREGVPPLYSVEDVEKVLRVWETRNYHEPLTVGEGLQVEFLNAGHILGSSIIRVKAEGKSVIFSGDLGNYPAPIIKDTETVAKADYCVIESTYGNRVHEPRLAREEQIEDAIEEAVQGGGAIIIPAFAMERTQDLLFHLNNLVEHNRIPRVPIFIDSPLAIKLTILYKKYRSYFDADTSAQIKDGDDIFNFPGLHLTLTTAESKAINEAPSPKIIIAGSGMSNGGRILHHERRYLADPKSTIIFVGYQAPGTLGRRILDGAPEVTIFGQAVPVRCKKKVLTGFSAHADQPRLLEWLRPMRLSLNKLFVVQGEPEASAALAQRARDLLAIDTVIPKAGESYVL